MGGGGLAVAVEWPGHGDGLVGADRVVGRLVGVGLGCELDAVVDVSAVEVLVFDGLEEPLDHPVGPRSPVSGADVGDVALGGDPGGEPGRFEAGPVVGDELQGADLAGVEIGEVLGPGDAQEVVDLGQGGVEEPDGVRGGLGDGHGASEVHLGPVVHDTAEIPGPGAVGLELGEVGLPQAVAPCGRVGERLLAHPGEPAGEGGVVRRKRQPVAGQHPIHRRVRHRARLCAVDAGTLEGGQLAVPPALPVSGQGLGLGLDGVLGRGRPRPLGRAGR